MLVAYRPHREQQDASSLHSAENHKMLVAFREERAAAGLTREMAILEQRHASFFTDMTENNKMLVVYRQDTLQRDARSLQTGQRTTKCFRLQTR